MRSVAHLQGTEDTSKKLQRLQFHAEDHVARARHFLRNQEGKGSDIERGRPLQSEQTPELAGEQRFELDTSPQRGKVKRESTWDRWDSKTGAPFPFDRENPQDMKILENPNWVSPQSRERAASQPRDLQGPPYPLSPEEEKEYRAATQRYPERPDQVGMWAAARGASNRTSADNPRILLREATSENNENNEEEIL